MKALIYCRVSSDRQVNEGHGLDSQEHRCKVFAKEKGLSVVAVFRDEGISGAIFERKGISELFDYISKHPFDKFSVIVDDPSRIARDVKVHSMIREQLRKMEADLISPNFQFDDTPEGELGENLIASINQYNLKANRRQVIQKQKARLEKGYWSFGFPPGLKTIKHPIHGKLLIPNEPIASIFKSAIEEFRDRRLLTQLDIVEYVNSQYRNNGIDKKISLHGVQLMLTKILYAGYIEFPKWDVSRRKGVHEGLISLETYEEVQNILQDRTKPKSRKDTNPDFPLRGLVLCAECHKPLTASWNTGRQGKKYPNYFCKTLDCVLRYKTIKRETLEENFLTRLKNMTLDRPMRDLVTAVFTDVWQQSQKNYAQEERNHKNELDTLTATIERLTDRISKSTNDILIRTYESELLKLGQKKEQFESVAFPSRYTSEQFGTATKEVLDILEHPVETWRTGDLNERLTVFFMHFDQKPTYDKHNGFGTAILASSVDLIHSVGNGKMSSVDISSETWKQLTEYIFKWQTQINRFKQSHSTSPLIPYYTDDVSHTNIRNIENGDEAFHPKIV